MTAAKRGSTQNKGKNGNGSNVAVGIALASLAAAAAGTLFLYGTKEGKKQRKNIKGFALKAKGEVLEKIEKLKDVNEDTYKEVVNSVLKKYKTLKNQAEEVKEVSTELMGYWKDIKKHLENISDVKKTKSSKSRAK